MKNNIHFTTGSFLKNVLSFFLLLFSVNGIAQPVIASFSPASGAAGSTVVIGGANFSTTAANDIVYFGAMQAAVINATATSLSVTVPSGASYQPISVLNMDVNLIGYSAQPFNLTFNNGNGQPISSSSFNTAVNFAVGSDPFSIAAISDIDGDGKPDFVAVNQYSNTFSVVRNISGGGNITTASFAPKVDFAADSTPSFIAIGDIDGDGKPDLVITNKFTNTISVFRNTSTAGIITSASFAAKVDFITDTLALPSSVAIGDIDGDGKADLVITNSYSNTVSVVKNTSTPGNISFAPPIDFVAGSAPNFVAITDIDGDGKPDLVVANYNSKNISVLQNISTTGSITASSFATRINFATDAGPYALATGDINNDGKPDVVVVNQGNDTLSVLTNNSTSGIINLAAKKDFSAGGISPFAVTMGNLDGDSLPDLVVSNAIGNTISILQNTYTSGGASFGTNVNFATGYFPFAAAISDLNGDGEADIVVPNYGNNTVSVFQNILPNNIVPVKLLDFTGHYQTTDNTLLNWQTTNEINAAYFNIQRSVNGTTFTTIGKQTAFGNSSLLENYAYTDAAVSKLGVDKIYYRLQEVDKNGAITYSNIVLINLQDKNNVISIYPNPTVDNLIIQHPGATSNAHVQITTIDGKQVWIQNISVGANQTSINVSRFSKGTYLLIFSDDTQKNVTRFVKL